MDSTVPYPGTKSSQQSLALDVPSNRFIANRSYDLIFFILSPIWAILIGIGLGGSPLGQVKYPFMGGSVSALAMFSYVFFSMHNVSVLFRSYVNVDIFKMHKLRFLLAPCLILVTLLSSKQLLDSAFVITIYWTIYHSVLQVFGFGRIYDAKLNADREAGRSLDFTLNMVVHIGITFCNIPLLHKLQPNLGRLAGNLLGTEFASMAGKILMDRPLSAALSVSSVAVYFIYYLWAYRRLVRQGYIVSREKIILFILSITCVAWAWIVNPYDQWYFMATFFHALQYIALVAHAERGHIAERIGLSHVRWGKHAALALMLTLTMIYGVWVQLIGRFNQTAFAFVICVNLLHFWYDGFIWSVRKKQI